MNQDPKDFKDIRDDFMIVKGRFKAVSQNFYGQFIVIFRNEKNFESYNAVASTFSDLYDLEPHEDWTKYREFIANIKWKGNFNANLSTSLIDQFKKFSQEMNSISMLYENVSNYDYNAMDITLYDLINRIIHDKNLILETAIQEITPSEYRAATTDAPEEQQAEEPAETNEEGFGVEDDAVILPVRPIVAPVRGKPIYELRIGDKLMVFLQAQSDRANYFIDKLKLREDNEIKPTPGEVIDIKAGSGKNNPTDILTLIAPGIYGKFTETEKQVKLKIYNPDTDGPPAIKKEGTPVAAGQPASKAGAAPPSFSKGTVIMMVLLMLILTLFVILIFLNWN
ncbi:MAG: hypothetical protein JW807_09930 [Spirochaetes bacterium]|nr:hypothetical protein [Spirochaetota bacterium]